VETALSTTNGTFEALAIAMAFTNTSNLGFPKLSTK
jgi:hypothetical protein